MQFSSSTNQKHVVIYVSSTHKKGNCDILLLYLWLTLLLYFIIARNTTLTTYHELRQDLRG